MLLSTVIRSWVYTPGVTLTPMWFVALIDLSYLQVMLATLYLIVDDANKVK